MNNKDDDYKKRFDEILSETNKCKNPKEVKEKLLEGFQRYKLSLTIHKSE